MIYNLTGAVIGSGAMGKRHLGVLKNYVKKIILCTNDIPTGEFLAKENNLIFYDNYIEMFEKEKLDFVSICLPTPLHHCATMEAIKHGINILCEKPFAQNAEEAKECLDAANEYGVTLMVGHCLRFFKPYEFLKRCINENRYGKLLYLDFFRHSKKPKWSVGDWLADQAVSGGVTRDLHIHDTDMVLNLLGMPKAIFTSGDTNVCRTIYNFENSNISVTASSSWRSPQSYEPVVGYDAIFENASLSLKNKDFILNTIDGTEENPLDNEDFPSCFIEGGNDFIKTEILYFCECLKNNQRTEMCLPEESYKTMLVNDAQLKSIKSKKIIEF